MENCCSNSPFGEFPVLKRYNVVGNDREKFSHFFLLQGNVEFVDDDEEQASIKNSEKLNIIAFLLGTEPRQVEKALCYRVVAANSEVVDKGHHAKEASHGRDALAKVQCTCIAGLFFV